MTYSPFTKLDKLECENDKMAGRLVFCYVMIAGLLVTIIALLCLWPN